MWLLVGFLVCAYVYSMRVIGPRAVPPGQQVVSRANVICFVGAMLILWGASDWPVHDIAEEYLYSVHMIQHMALSYFLPPLALMATPTWLARTMIGDGRVYQVMRRLTHPVVAAVLFNGTVMIVHIPLLVNASVTSSESGAALQHARTAGDDCAADVDARVRPDSRVPDLGDGLDDLPVPAVGRADDPGRVADVRRRRRLQGIRPAGAALGDQRRRGPADSRGRR